MLTSKLNLKEGPMGNIKIKLYQEALETMHRESKTSLFSPENRFIKAKRYDKRHKTDAAFIQGLPFEMVTRPITKQGIRL
jgi:hypothetical protein